MRSIVMGYRFALVLLFVAGCKFKDNTLYCEGHPDDPDCSTHSDGPNTCSDTAQCHEPTGVCDLDVGMCVQCTTAEAQACMGTTPICTNDACAACTSNAQCSDSDVCLPDGSCAAPAEVAYVASGGGGTACTKAAPCGTLANGLGANKSIVKIASGLVKDNKTTTIDGKAVTIIADPGAKLDRDGDGAIVLVESAGANVTIVDLEVTGQTGVADAAIDLQPNGGAPALSLIRVTVDSNQGVGVSASGGTLSVSQSTISGNTGGGIFASGGSLSVFQSTISGNTGGGISASGTLDIVNNFIHHNGLNNAGHELGGVSLTPSGASRFEFNTVIDNDIENSVTSAGGVLCQSAGFAAPNNIIARNRVNSDATKTNSNTIGLCTFPTTTISQTVTALKFASPDSSPFDYHLTAGSSAIDQATTPSTTTIDIDGETRPKGATNDQGADEAR